MKKMLILKKLQLVKVIEIVKGKNSYSKTLVKPDGIDFIKKLIDKEKTLLESVNS